VEIDEVKGAGEARDDRTGVRSLVVGARVLRAISRNGGSASLTTIATASGMAPAKVHRYLAGYVAADLVVQDRASGHYALGALALEIGVTAMRRLDPVSASEGILTELRDLTGESISLTVWGTSGPTVVRWLEGTRSFALATRIGEVLPVLSSANGLVYAAFLPPAVTQATIDAELVIAPSLRDGLAERLDAVRTAGSAYSDGVQPGIISVAAPVVDYERRVRASIAIVAVVGTIDLGPSSAATLALREAVGRISLRLGAVP
jgi:DNA-binding IclR family transcriptional regulator